MNLRLEWVYKHPKRTARYQMTTDYMSINEALLLEEDLIKTGRSVSCQFFDEDDASWTRKDLLRFLKAMETEPHQVKAYIDGGYRKESNEAGLGLAIYYQQNGQHWRYRVNERIDEIDDNNEAEYAALAYLFTIAEELGIHHQALTIYTDSKTLYHQMTGEWPCYEETLIRWNERIEEKVAKLGLKPTYSFLGRHLNKEADQLASQALDGIFIEGKKEQTKKEDVT
ncbi:reverse transcriptase-like protein [Alkalihalobacillus sp. FSL W8-0930]